MLESSLRHWEINLVSNAGASNITPGESNDKKLESILNVPPSRNSSDKASEKTCPLKSPNMPSFENIQAGANSDNSFDCNLSNEQAGDNVQRPRPESVKLLTPSIIINESLLVKPCDGKCLRKLKKKVSKCRIRNMPISFKNFKASLRKKKHKKSKRRILDPNTLSIELLLDENCSSDVGAIQA